MAKAVVETKEVTPLNANGPALLDDEMRSLYEADAGAGVSSKADDRLLPFVLILQKGSPEVNKQDPKYVEGAEPGMFLMRGSAPKPTMWVQPLVMQKKIVEWGVPRGTGMLGRYDKLPEGLTEQKRKNQIIKWTSEGSEFIDTRYQYVNIVGEDKTVTPAVISFSGTGHSRWKEWNMQMGTKHLQNGAVAPSYSNLYKIGTKWTKNAMGDWFAFTVLESRWITPEEKDLVKMGKALMVQILAGEKEAGVHDDVSAEPAEEIPF